MSLSMFSHVGGRLGHEHVGYEVVLGPSVKVLHNSFSLPKSSIPDVLYWAPWIPVTIDDRND